MNKTIILIIVAFVMFMEAVDTTIINTAIPVMAHSLKADPVSLKLALISYLLSLAIFIPISGWLADKFGAKKIFMTAITIFTLSSIWCGFTTNLLELIVARFIQGLGGSIAMPVGRLIIIRTCERHELVSKLSIVVMIGAIGLMLGPVLGGLITNYFSWRWIFWVNAPIGLIAFLLAYYLLPYMPPRQVHRLDKLGFILFGSSLALLTYSFASFSETLLSDARSLITISAAILLLLSYAWHSQNKSHPIVKINLLSIRTFRVAIIGNLICRIGFGGIPFLLPLLLQISLSYSPQTSGLLLAPTALGVLITKPLAVYILRFLGYKKLLILNTLLVGFSLISFSFINEYSTLLKIGILTFIYGLLISLQYTGMNSLAYANVEPEDLSAATSIMSTVQQISQSFGVAIAAILLHVFTPAKTSLLSIDTLHHTFIAMGLVTCLSLLIFSQLKQQDGQELIHVPT
ncbi:MFS transporter [Legionella gresilensis]|uniref:MFS transporter n=1 Tax=Legionella gresilensis TaxID=91823 RepID=UPI00104199D1|nr:MFS transporter [Legionella gresilensis]